MSCALKRFIKGNGCLGGILFLACYGKKTAASSISIGVYTHFGGNFKFRHSSLYNFIMAFIDYYKILGLEKSASTDDIKKAYRKLARKHHPDLNPNDKQAHVEFQQINEANEVLSDPEKRKKYDEYGENWKHADQFEAARQQQSTGPGDRGSFSSDEGDQYSDFFESLFGSRFDGGRGFSGGSGKKGKFRGSDYTTTIEKTLHEAYTTHQQTLQVHGKNVRITIPAGIQDGQVIKLSGYGSAGVNGGPNGDLYITFKVNEDPVFKRVDNDLYSTLVLDLFTAVLGGEITTATFNGKVKLKINAGTQNGAKIRLKGKGFPLYKQAGLFGDLIITVNVNIPTDLNEEQLNMFRQISKSYHKN